MYVYMSQHTCGSLRQLVGMSSLLPRCGSQECGRQTERQAYIPAEPSFLFKMFYFSFYIPIPVPPSSPFPTSTSPL